MKASQHPEYVDEKKKLSETIDGIQFRLNNTRNPPLVYGADQRAARELFKLASERIDTLKQARNDLYFGRVDWQETSDQKPDIFYIGKQAVPDLHVYSWRETLPGKLYYEGASKTGGKYLLKRTFEITQDQLKEIDDDYVAPDRVQLLGLQVAVIETPTSSDKLLLDILEHNREGQLHDIVVTIQQEQFQLISSPLKSVLVIQGAAGSGKTAIALHRLAYLLFQHEKSGDLSRNRLLYLAPNPVFLHYVARVLPELGERKVPQKTFDEWMLSRLGAKLDYEPEEAALETLLDLNTPESVRVMRYRNARNKGSLKMAQLLDGYVDHLFEQMAAELGAFEFSLSIGRQRDTEPSLSCLIPIEQIRDLLQQSRRERGRNIPFNSSRSRFRRILEEALVSQLHQQRPSRSIQQYRQDIGEKVSQADIEAYLRPWESINVSIAYRGLLRSVDLLRRVGEGIFDRWALELLHTDAPKQGTPFRFSDLGALLYLNHLIEGTPDSEMLDHIVVDEAQDITPLQFMVLQRTSRNQSLTIMGDLAQRIYSDHGLQAWNELDAIFNSDRIQHSVIRRSYRSTQPIIDYANNLLRRIGAANDLLAEPLARQGPSPEEIEFADETARISELMRIIASEQNNGRQSIAIIVKTAGAARDLASALEAAGNARVQLIDSRAAQYDGKVAVLPAYLTKGLEFDTVIVADADADTYPAHALEARLLYVVLTRASHNLYVGWIGSVTPLLDSSQNSVAVIDYYEERLRPVPVTLAEFVGTSEPSEESDVLVERLASASKLSLLQDGRIDSTTMAVLASGWARQVDNEVVVIPELDPEARVAVRKQVMQFSDSTSQVEQNALICLQLAYGLLRNVLRGIGIILSEDQEADMGEQAIALARFLNAIRTTSLTYSVGQPTTERRVLDAMSADQREYAASRLHQLSEYGMVETLTQAKGKRIRVPHEWIENLVLVSLGHTPPLWDADLRADWPCLPHPISQQILPSDVVGSLV